MAQVWQGLRLPQRVAAWIARRLGANQRPIRWIGFGALVASVEPVLAGSPSGEAVGVRSSILLRGVDDGSAG